MRLIYYINEREEKIKEIDNLDDAIKILKNKCSKYLKETKGNWFIRGLKTTKINEYSLNYKTIRKNRSSKGMMDVFTNFNKWLEENGHVRRDQSISVTSDVFHADMFVSFKGGSLIVPFIEGNYNYSWVKAADINQTNYKNNGWYGNIVRDYLNMYKINWKLKGKQFILNFLEYNNSNSDEDNTKIAEKWLKKNFPKYFTTNKGMQIAYKNKYELWFKAKGYYYVHYDDELSKYLRKVL